MSANTTNQQITYPVGTDLADNPTAFLDMLADVENRLVQRYTSDADRTARNPAPTIGELSFVAGGTWYDRWTGTKWLPVTTLKVMKTATQTVNNSTALVNDTELFIAFPATGGVSTRWSIEGWIAYTSTIVADFQVTFAAHANITGREYTFTGLATTATGTTGDFTAQRVTGSAALGGAGAAAGIGINGFFSSNGLAGTLQLQWAQNTLEATNTQVFSGSWLKVTAIQ